MRQPEVMTAQDTKLWHTLAFADADRMILSLIHISEPTRPY